MIKKLVVYNLRGGLAYRNVRILIRNSLICSWHLLQHCSGGLFLALKETIVSGNA